MHVMQLYFSNKSLLKKMTQLATVLKELYFNLIFNLESHPVLNSRPYVAAHKRDLILKPVYKLVSKVYKFQ